MNTRIIALAFAVAAAAVVEARAQVCVESPGTAARRAAVAGKAAEAASAWSAWTSRLDCEGSGRSTDCDFKIPDEEAQFVSAVEGYRDSLRDLGFALADYESAPGAACHPRLKSSVVEPWLLNLAAILNNGENFGKGGMSLQAISDLYRVQSPVGPALRALAADAAAAGVPGAAMKAAQDRARAEIAASWGDQSSFGLDFDGRSASAQDVAAVPAGGGVETSKNDSGIPFSEAAAKGSSSASSRWAAP